MKIIEEEFVEKIINYLSTRPWAEVNQAIVILKNLKNLPPPPSN
jgi:hypothetical protein